MGKQYRINQWIKSPEVNVIDENGEQLGILPISRALDLAQSRESDLVEVSPKANPPVCRIMDYGKFQYQQQRSQQKKSKKVELKGVRLSFKIGQHDLLVKQKQVHKFLSQGHKVNIELRLRGRERAFREKARELIKQFIEDLGEECKVDKPISQQGGIITAIITKNK